MPENVIVWAHLRFPVIGQLLAAPPPRGKLRAELERLAGQNWRHPSGVTFVCEKHVPAEL
jgi:hypothetical protein